MAGNDRETVEIAVAKRAVARVDEVHTAGQPGVRLVGDVGVGEAATRAVVGAPAGAEAALRVAGRSEDHVIGVRVDAAEVGGEGRGLGLYLILRRARGHGRAVDPGARKLVAGVGRVGAVCTALRGAVGHALAVLGRR